MGYVVFLARCAYFGRLQCMLHGCSDKLISGVLYVDCLTMLSMCTIITNKVVALLRAYFCIMSLLSNPYIKLLSNPYIKLIAMQ